MARGIVILYVILAHIPIPGIPDVVNRICYPFHMDIYS